MIYNNSIWTLTEGGVRMAGKRIHSLVVLLALLNLLFHVSDTKATTLKKLSLEELASHADTIVIGTCEKVESVWRAKKIYTIATIRVREPMQGEEIVGQEIPVYILGGRVKKPLPIKMHVPGAAKIAPAEEMILFLKKQDSKAKTKTTRKEPQTEKDPSSYFRIVGMAQGKIPIITNPKTKEKTVHYGQAIKGVKFVDEDNPPNQSGKFSPSSKRDSLAGFKAGLKKIMEKQAKQAPSVKQKTPPRAGPDRSQKGGAQ
jgi:hypothetical protein